MILYFGLEKRYCGSMAEQLTRNEQVVSSILTSSSRKGRAFGRGLLFYHRGKNMELVIRRAEAAERLYTGPGFIYADSREIYYADTGWTKFELYEHAL